MTAGLLEGFAGAGAAGSVLLLAATSDDEVAELAAYWEGKGLTPAASSWGSARCSRATSRASSSSDPGSPPGTADRPPAAYPDALAPRKPR